MLKNICKKPQLVYTGIAVINIENKKVFTACEKTKIYMDYIDNSEIREYFRRVSPLDKAGGFDVQGIGGIFVRRIEGCFYNVVGLPIFRLYRILRKLNVNIF